MLVNEYITTNPLQEALDRITEQFKDKPVFNKFLELLISPAVEMEETYRALMQERSLDTAVGAQLDMIGNLVGQPRTLVNADLYTFFGFKGEITADSYGTLNDPSVGGVWWDGESATTGNITLVDDLYRILIKAKIAKHLTRATPEDVMQLASFVFGAKTSSITDEGYGAFTLLIGRILTKQEVGLLRWVNHTGNYDTKLLPKPVGVRMNYGHFNSEKVFAFQGVPNAMGYGSLDYSMRFDGGHLYNGEVPVEGVLKDKNGEDVGGVWASFIEIEKEEQ